jgi:ribosomal protein S18 acetylase RimI-like enzyme
MFETRVATAADAELIADHRWRMYAEMGHGNEESLRGMVESFILWVRERLADGRYVGWLGVGEAQQVVAGAGMWLMDFPPHWLDPQPLRAYLLNFYVAPEVRGRGLAFALLRTAVEEARRRGIKVVSLHASNAGRPIYERSGFEATNEMMLYLS